MFQQTYTCSNIVEQKPPKLPQMWQTRCRNVCFYMFNNFENVKMAGYTKIGYTKIGQLRSSWNPIVNMGIGGHWNGLGAIGMDWGQIEWIWTQDIQSSSDLCDDLLRKSRRANASLTNMTKRVSSMVPTRPHIWGGGQLATRNLFHEFNKKKEFHVWALE